ncbi:hypothetical protein N665_2242s0003 [Sinapis alba]|nr:hypothetical protein N665_2242s0003 [Sinapis alba]
MHMLGERHKDVLLMEKASLTPPSLTSLMHSKYRQFQAAINKDKIRWDSCLTKLILIPGQTLMKAIHIVFTPMVGLAINLVVRHVEVFNPLTSLYNDVAVLKFLKPILHILLYLIRYVAKVPSCDLSPFTWHRTPDTYQNLRFGDCRPISVKLWKCTSMATHTHTCSGSQTKTLTTSTAYTQCKSTKTSYYPLTMYLPLPSHLRPCLLQVS